MARFKDPRALAAHQARRYANAKRSLKLGLDVVVNSDMRGEAIRLTSGNIPQEVFDKLGNPLGRGRGRISTVKPFRSGGRRRRARVSTRGSIPALPINKQSGRGQRSLRIIPRASGYSLQFTDPGITFRIMPGGTRKMVASGFWEAMRKKYAREKKKLLSAKRAAESR